MSKSNNYVYYVREALDYVEDPEIKDLILDIAKLLHDLEWFTENVQNPDMCEEVTYNFRKKWFGNVRNDRLKEYINTMCDAMKADVAKLISEEG